MSQNEKTLTAEQRRAIVALMSCKTVTDAATQAGVSERTLYRWMAEPVFKAELNATQTEAMAHATRRLTQAMNTAADVILDTMQNADKRSDRLKAALGLVNVLPSLRELVDFEGRLQALESAQKKGGAV